MPERVRLGVGPEVEVEDLPDPPVRSLRDVAGVLRIIGPSAIVLGVAIGAGEWLIGPANVALYGPYILWIATVSILLQTVLNIEIVRYTMYTGEPIFNGMLRLWPGKSLWLPVLVVLSILERAWPAWAFASATAFVAMFLGRIPGDADAVLVMLAGVFLVFLCIAIVSVGGVVERALEIAQWLMVFFIIGMLVFLNAIATPAPVAVETAKGFFTFGYLPAGASITLLAALAGYAGAGGLNNTTITNYYRDKGFGMGARVGAIPSLIGGKKITVSPVGKVFRVSEENLRRWRTWRALSIIDIVGIFTLGAFIGMYLTTALTAALIPIGTKISGWGVAAYQGEYFAKILGPVGWGLALLAGFWILFSTQLGSTDMITRTLTDLLWSSSERLRSFYKNNIRGFYYTVLGFIAAWTIFAFALTYIFKIQPLIWILLVANMSNLVLAVTAVATAYINRRWLPREIRAHPVMTALLLMGAVFWLTFAVIVALATFAGIKI